MYYSLCIVLIDLVTLFMSWTLVVVAIDQSCWSISLVALYYIMLCFMWLME